MERIFSIGFSVSRGLLVGTVMLYVLPSFFGPDTIWFATPIAEISVAIVTAFLMKKYTREVKD